jgi:hypothetical protein
LSFWQATILDGPMTKSSCDQIPFGGFVFRTQSELRRKRLSMKPNDLNEMINRCRLMQARLTKRRLLDLALKYEAQPESRSPPNKKAYSDRQRDEDPLSVAIGNDKSFEDEFERLAPERTTHNRGPRLRIAGLNELFAFTIRDASDRGIGMRFPSRQQ